MYTCATEYLPGEEGAHGNHDDDDDDDTDDLLCSDLIRCPFSSKRPYTVAF